MAGHEEAGVAGIKFTDHNLLAMQQILALYDGKLEFLYGRTVAEEWMPELERILKVHHAHKPAELCEQEAELVPAERFSQRDQILITYADAVRSRESTGIEALHRFVETYYDSINTVHMLPFFPYSSDRGFAVVDLKSVDPKVGSWDQVRELALDYDLMFDAVFNHVSSRSEMFRGFLRGDPETRWNAHKIALETNVLDADEVRQVEGWNPRKQVAA